MRKAGFLLFLLTLLLPIATHSQTVQTIAFDPNDAAYGHYLLVEPKNKPIEGVLVLLGGFGEVPEAVFPETKLENVAYTHRVLTVAIGVGGALALRYTELSQAFAGKFATQPKGVFMVDSPIDIFSIWDALEESRRNQYSDIAVEEAVRAMEIIRNEYGVPRENVDTYARINAFNLNKAYGEPEKYLKSTAVRAYHD
eukprot:gene5484-7005_t